MAQLAPSGSRPATKTPLPRSSSTPVKVLVVGQDARFILSIFESMSRQPGITLAGSAVRSADVVERTVLLRPDVVVIDMDHRSRTGGLHTAHDVRRVAPTVGVLMVSPDANPDRLATFPVMRGLPYSFILASTAKDPKQLVAAISQTSWSMHYVDPAVEHRIFGVTTRRAAISGAIDQGSAVPADPVLGWQGKSSVFRLDEEPSGPTTEQKAKWALLKALSEAPRLRLREYGFFKTGDA